MAAMDTPIAMAIHTMVMVTMAMDARKDLQSQTLTMVAIGMPDIPETTGDKTD